jgi:biopolymer transport protein ExbB
MKKAFLYFCAASLLLTLPIARAADNKTPVITTAASARTILANESKSGSQTNVSGTNAASTNLMGSTPGGTNAPANVKYTTGWGQKLKQGGNTALIQLGLSIFGAGYIFERFFRLRRKFIIPEGLADRARGLWKAGKFDELEKLGETDPCTLSRVIVFIVKNRQSPMLEVSEICGDIVTRELSSHYQKAYPLGIVATLEPLLGLLGMILGMITTFETVALAGALGDATQLSTGISEALVTTGLGLAIAIPFLGLYHVFKHKTTSFGSELEEEVTNLLAEWLMKKEVKK